MLMTLAQAKAVRTMQLCGKYVTPYLLAEAIAVIRASVKKKKKALSPAEKKIAQEMERGGRL